MTGAQPCREDPPPPAPMFPITPLRPFLTGPQPHQSPAAHLHCPQGGTRLRGGPPPPKKKRCGGPVGEPGQRGGGLPGGCRASAGAQQESPGFETGRWFRKHWQVLGCSVVGGSQKAVQSPRPGLQSRCKQCPLVSRSALHSRLFLEIFRIEFPRSLPIVYISI